MADRPGPASAIVVALGQQMSRWREWGRRGWKPLLWLFVLLLLSRLLYLPWSQGLAATDKSALVIPANTSVLLEGVTMADTPALTLEIDGLRSVTLLAPRAVLAPRTHAALAAVGARLPARDPPQALAWNINRPPEAKQEGLLRFEIAPAADSDLLVGTRDDLLAFGSTGDLEVQATPQDYDLLSGSLRLGRDVISQAPDIPLEIQASPGSSGAAQSVSLAISAGSTTLGLGDFRAGRNSIAIRSVALLDEDGMLVRRLCGARRNSVLLWSALFQLRLDPQPPASACRDGHLTASNLRMTDGGFRLSLSGAAYVSGTSQWFAKLQGNIVLWPFIAALIAIPGARFWKAVARKGGAD